MIKNFLKWFFSPSKKPILEDHIDVYSKLIELENRVKVLEEESVETTNSMYEIANSLESRIDILSSEPYNLDKFTLNK